MPNISGWFRPSAALQRVYARSEIQSFPSHYVPTLGSKGKSARCIGDGCRLCEWLPVHRHGILVVQVGITREIKLLELRESHAEALAECYEMGPRVVGRPVFVWIDTTEHGHPIRVTLDRPDDCPRNVTASVLDLKPVPCERYCARIGTREYSEALAHLPILVEYLEKQKPASVCA